MVMAPMTRSFSPNGIPTEKVAEYYKRRAEDGVGLILSEGTTIARDGSRNDENIPLFYGEAPLKGWAKVIKAVHKSGGRMGPQIWLVGSAPNRNSQWKQPDIASPSGLSAPGQPRGRVMSEQDIADSITAFASAAAAGYKATTQEQLELMERIALLKYKHANYGEAIRMLNECIDLQKTQNGEDNPEVADLYAHLGMVYRGSMIDSDDAEKAKEDFENSKTAYLKALTIRKRLLPSAHPELAATYSFLADLYDDRGNNAEAAKLRTKAESLMEQNEIQVTGFPLPTAIFPPYRNSWSQF